jgi:tetratricopeptide (TPR) repeat protein
MLNYNHEMAIGCFTEALAADPDCAMAHWGIAYGVSSNYNWPPGLGSGHDAIQLAVGLKDKVSELEKDLIDALAARHSAEARDAADPTKLAMGNDPKLNAAFAKEMAKVYAKYPQDLDVAAIYAEGLMNLKPWALWNKNTSTGEIIAADDNTTLAVDIIEKGFEIEGGKQHPALCHLYCHALELSPFPEKALPYADTLRTLMPDCGHLVHMPSHIDAWVGQWKEGMDCNIDGVAADDKFVKTTGKDSMFYKFYRMHNTHFVVWCAQHIGAYEIAMKYARKAEAQLPAGDKDSGVSFMLAGIIPMGAIFLESYLTMPWHVMIRFGKWDDILAEPLREDRAVFPAAIATQHYARGIAFAAKGQVAEAEAEQTKFVEALSNEALAGRVLHNNAMYDASGGPCILEVNRALLAGEIEYRKAAQKKAADGSADFKVAFDHLRKGVDLSLNLKYNEPWGQMMPVRHALGALLLEQDETDEALEVFQDDVKLWKNNMWGLLGVKLCLEKQKAGGADVDAALTEAEVAFKEASKHADSVPEKTCFCAWDDAGASSGGGCGCGGK